MRAAYRCVTPIARCTPLTAYASHMVMNNVPLATVKEILRHKDYSTTLRYSHLSPEHRKEAVEALGEALKVKPKGESKTA